MQQIFIIDDCHRKITLQMMGRMWRHYKSILTNKIKELAESSDVATELERFKPHNLAKSDWEAFVKARNSLDFKVSNFFHSWSFVNLHYNVCMYVYSKIYLFYRRGVRNLKKYGRNKLFITQWAERAMHA